MADTCIIGIDPGASGGIAWCFTDRPRRDGMFACKFGSTESDIRADLLAILERSREVHAYVEKVWATPQMGRTSAFTFGRGYGFLRGILCGLGIPFEEVSSLKWQQAFSLREKGRTIGKEDTKKHNAIKAKAQQLYPWLKITHATAAPLLICEWGARQHRPISAQGERT
jgi:hypothetical protein